MNDKSSTYRARDPRSINAWLIRSDITSRAIAVCLSNNNKVLGSHIYILNRHEPTEDEITSYIDANIGFIINPRSLPYFYDECVKNLLSLVLTSRGLRKSLLDSIRG